MKLEELIDIAINRYIEQDIIRLDVSDATKNRLKRDLRKIFKDEDLINDIKEESIPRAVVEEKIKAKIEEVKDGTFDAKIVLQSLLEKE